MQYEHFDCDIRDGIAHIRLIGPDTPLPAAMCDEFLDLLLRLQDDNAVRVLLVTDGDNSFDLATNLNDLAEARRGDGDFGPVAADLDLSRKVVTMMQEMIKPVVTATRGDVRGAGLGFFLAGDVRIAGRSASFTAPDVTAGLMPEWGLTFTLPRLLGPGRFLEFLWSGRTLDADEAARLGLVDRVFRDESWEDDLTTFLERLVHLPQPMLRLTKLASQQNGQLDLTAMLSYEFESQLQCWDSQETAEGLRAWQEGRRPVFQAPLGDPDEEDEI
jgi:enoyl-CoA hydratase/carnithine racemase